MLLLTVTLVTEKGLLVVYEGCVHVSWYGQGCVTACVGGLVPLLELASEASAEALSGSTLSFEATVSAIASSEALDSSIEPVSSPATINDLEASSGFLPPTSADFPFSMKLHSEEAPDSPEGDL